MPYKTWSLVLELQSLNIKYKQQYIVPIIEDFTNFCKLKSSF